MGFKAREYEGMTKAELIKALRASVAREAKLQKRIAALEQDNVLRQPAEGARTGRITHVVPGADTVSDLAPPAFPWDVK